MSMLCPNPSCGRSVQVAERDPDGALHCPHCGQSIPAVLHKNSDASTDPYKTTDQMPAADGMQAALLAAGLPDRIGRFVVKALLGEGSFGRVYRAHDPQLDRDVALKVAKPNALLTAEQRERFLREARSTAQLRHPHIVPIFDAEGKDGQYYIASAYIQGRTLQEYIRAERPGQRRSAQLVRQLAEALAYAHEQGIVHRDVKPANVIMDEGERGSGSGASAAARPLLMDFGLAVRKTDVELTHAGTILGTPLYMSPQVRGQGGEALPASDQYSLGVVLYELLRGRPPFVGTIETVMDGHKNQEPPPLSKEGRRVPRDLETICLKCLEKEPSKRYADGQALADDLRRWLEGEPIQARRLSVFERAWRWTRRNPSLAASLAAVFVLLLSGVVGTSAALVEISDVNVKEHQARTDAEKSLAKEQEALKEKGKALDEKEEERKAREVQFQKTRYNLHVAQLYRAAAIYERNPMDARALLHDCNHCPIDLRDTVWQIMDAYCRRWEPVTIMQYSIENDRLLTLSSDGRTIASTVRLPPRTRPFPFDEQAAALGEIRLWDVASREVRATLQGHKGEILRAAFSSDGKTLASTSEDKTVKLWDVASGKERLTIKGHEDLDDVLAFISDGKTLASASEDGTAKLWDLTLDPGPLLASLNGHTDSLTCLAYSPDGRLLASGSRDQTVRLWDLSTGQEQATLRGHAAALTALAFSADGRALRSRDANGVTKEWNATTGKEQAPSGEPPPDAAAAASAEECLRAFGLNAVRTEHATALTTLALSPDRRLLASGSDDKTIKLWLWDRVPLGANPEMLRRLTVPTPERAKRPRASPGQ